MKEKRIDFIDIYKGIGIFLMILGHINLTSKIDYFIGAFHMPMFFLISGFLFKGENNVNLYQYIKKKFNNLIIPYFSFGLFYYIIYAIINLPKFSFQPLLQLVTDNTNYPIGGAIWFLTALFICDIIYIYIYREKNTCFGNTV